MEQCGKHTTVLSLLLNQFSHWRHLLFFWANQPVPLADFIGLAFVTALVKMAIRSVETANVVKVE